MKKCKYCYIPTMSRYSYEDNILDQIHMYKANCSDFFLREFKILRVIEENTYLKNFSSLQERAHKIGI